MVSCTGLSLFLGTSTLLGKQNSLDVGQDATLSNGNASEELVQLFVVPAWYSARVTEEALNIAQAYLIASCKCLGMILVFLLSLAAFPASSRISAARYSITAAM